MRVPVGREFWLQIERYEFRFCCEECAHHDAERDECAHGWPAAEHRRERFMRREVTTVSFCKEFELG